jgi:hypothetical protein
MGGSIPNEMLCSSSCDITTTTGCPVAGAACELGQEQSGQMRFFTFCSTAGTKAKNQPCTMNTDCMATLGCINLGTQTVCAQYCYVNLPPPAGCSICTPLTYGTAMMSIYLGSNQVGVCQ